MEKFKANQFLPAEGKDGPKESELNFSNFIKEVKTSDSVFWLDKELSIEEIEERKCRLEELLAKMEKASPAQRKILEQESELSRIPSITEEARVYLNALEKDPETEQTEGAENKNLIFVNSAGEKRVLKVSKGRHDQDPISIVKLMRNMCALELFERQQKEFMSLQEGEININVLFDNIVIYRDAEGNYKRMIDQPFAKGESVGRLMAGRQEYDDLQKAWKKFLEQIDLLQATSEVVLDITDSTQGAKPSRGDVSRTGNVFVERSNDSDTDYNFQIIDIDVFDDPLMDTKKEKGLQHKFSASEQIRKKGSISSAIKVFLTNISRELYVKPMQDHYIKKELEK